MNTPKQDHQVAAQPAEQTTPPAPRQPWRRPTVTFVPMQATAGGKSAVGTDNAQPGDYSV